MYSRRFVAEVSARTLVLQHLFLTTRWTGRTLLWGLLVASLATGQWSSRSQKLNAQEPSINQISVDAAQQQLGPLSKAIRDAKSLRATIRLNVVSAIGAEVLGKDEGVFQLASTNQNLLAISAKFAADAVRIQSDGTKMFLQLSPSAYVESPPPANFAELITAMPIQLGPQPEPMLWLSLAGVNPGENLLASAMSVESIAGPVIEGAETRLLRVVRPDGVQWELQLTHGEQPRPISLRIDLTKMITQANNLTLPDGYTFKLEYEFQRWELNGEIASELFQYQPPAGAERFESIADFVLKQDQTASHPLLGKPAPHFTTKSLTGDDIQVDYQDDSVIVLDFWATWCAPCVESLPEFSQLTKQFAGQPVKFYAVNVSEENVAIESFLKDKQLELTVLIDPRGDIANAFAASAIPLTVLIGKGGRVEAVHVGFDPSESSEILKGEIESLLAGRKLYQAEEVEQSDAPATVEQSAEEVAPDSPRNTSKSPDSAGGQRD